MDSRAISVGSIHIRFDCMSALKADLESKYHSAIGEFSTEETLFCGDGPCVLGNYS